MAAREINAPLVDHFFIDLTKSCSSSLFSARSCQPREGEPASHRPFPSSFPPPPPFLTAANPISSHLHIGKVVEPSGGGREDKVSSLFYVIGGEKKKESTFLPAKSLSSTPEETAVYREREYAEEYVFVFSRLEREIRRSPILLLTVGCGGRSIN